MIGCGLTPMWQMRYTRPLKHAPASKGTLW